MSDGMFNQARARSNRAQWLHGPAEQLPFDDGALDAVVTTLVAVATLSARRQPLLQVPSAGFAVADQHRVRRPVRTWILSDLITVGTKS
jgi:hypothetical protein